MMSSDRFSSPPSSLTSFIHDPVPNPNPNHHHNNSSSVSGKRKRNQAGNPDPEAEVIALSPTSLMATNRFVCEICNKGFQRDQNLQLHRRGHNLPWKLKQRNKNEVVKKKVYICPEKSCVHHDPSRALGDLTGVKKHFSRKHGEKKWKCEKCSKKYAVQSDWKAHSKICGTREYICDCGTVFSRKDSFITHRAFCDALMDESTRIASRPIVPCIGNVEFRNDMIIMNEGGSTAATSVVGERQMWLNHNANNPQLQIPNNSTYLGSSSSNYNNTGMLPPDMVNWLGRFTGLPQGLISLKEEEQQTQKDMQLNSMYNNLMCSTLPRVLTQSTPVGPAVANMSSNMSPNMSATALLQKAAQMGSTQSTNSTSGNDTGFGLIGGDGLMMMAAAATGGLSESKGSGGGGDFGEGDFTRDFLGVERNDGSVSFNLQQELSKFTSSTMGFNQFNRNG